VGPRGSELIRRYKKNYGIPHEADITEAMILHHWELERQLTAELLWSRPENRWDTFDRCYTRLYTELEWLNRYVGKADSVPPAVRFDRWVELIGPPPKSVYEIWSGKGDLTAGTALNEGYTEVDDIINIDPLFISFSNFHLLPASPAINAGIDVGLTSDFDGNPVPSGLAPDIGAYEFQLQ
jgi:hypothetical protein